jgi:hypothetical protein
MTHVDRAILDALDRGCTGKTRALAQAYRTLRNAGWVVTRDSVYAAWVGLLQMGAIIRDGRQYLAKTGVQHDDQ